MQAGTRREAGYQAPVGNMINMLLQEIDEVLLLLTGIPTLHVAVADHRRRLRALLRLPRPQLAGANIDYLRTVTAHPCVTSVHHRETTVSIVYGTSNERRKTRGTETATLTDTTTATMDEEMTDIILPGMIEVMEIMTIDIGDREGAHHGKTMVTAMIMAPADVVWTAIAQLHLALPLALFLLLHIPLVRLPHSTQQTGHERLPHLLNLRLRHHLSPPPRMKLFPRITLLYLFRCQYEGLVHR